MLGTLMVKASVQEACHPYAAEEQISPASAKAGDGQRSIDPVTKSEPMGRSS